MREQIKRGDFMRHLEDDDDFDDKPDSDNTEDGGYDSEDNY